MLKARHAVFAMIDKLQSPSLSVAGFGTMRAICIPVLSEASERLCIIDLDDIMDLTSLLI